MPRTRPDIGVFGGCVLLPVSLHGAKVDPQTHSCARGSWHVCGTSRHSIFREELLPGGKVLRMKKFLELSVDTVPTLRTA